MENSINLKFEDIYNNMDEKDEKDEKHKKLLDDQSSKDITYPFSCSYFCNCISYCFCFFLSD